MGSISVGYDFSKLLLRDKKNKLQKLEDALWKTGETGGNRDTGLTGSTVLRHEINPKMGDWVDWAD